MSKNKRQFFRAPRNVPNNLVKPVPHILGCIFGERERRGWYLPELATEIMRMIYGTGSGRYKFTWCPMTGVHPISAARNRLVDYFLEKTDCDWLMMFDNDIQPPENVIEVLLNAPQDASVIILPYWVWNPHTLLPLPCVGRWEEGEDGKKKMITQDYKTHDYCEIGAGGTGAMFIRRSVFEKLSKPFFKIIYDDLEGQVVSEDIYFTSRATEAGLKIYTHIDYICGHHRTMDLAEVNAGMVSRIRAGFDLIRERYGDHGIAVPTITDIQDLKTKHNVWRMDELGNWTCPTCDKIWGKDDKATCVCK